MDDEKFMQELAELYQSLLERQERMPPEFERAIFENIEELYVYD